MRRNHRRTTGRGQRALARLMAFALVLGMLPAGALASEVHSHSGFEVVDGQGRYYLLEEDKKELEEKEGITFEEPGENPGGEPATEEPGTGEPGTEEPGTEEPGTGESGSEEPGTGESGSEEPGTGESGSEEPGTGESGSEEPGTEEPGSEEPGTGESGSEEPGTEESGSEESTPEDSTTEETTTESALPPQAPVRYRPAGALRFTGGDTGVSSGAGSTPDADGRTPEEIGLKKADCGCWYFDAYAVTVDGQQGYVVPAYPSFSNLGGDGPWYLNGQKYDSLDTVADYVAEQAARGTETFTAVTRDVIVEETPHLFNFLGIEITPIDDLKQPVDVSTIARVQYDVKFCEEVYLKDLANFEATFTMQNFAKYFTTQGGNTVSVQLQLSTDAGGSPIAFEIGRATLSQGERDLTVTLKLHDAATMQTNYEQIKASVGSGDIAFDLLKSLTASFTFNSRRNDTDYNNKDSVSLGDTELSLGWGDEVEAPGPGCTLEKTAGEYKAETNQLTWTITLTPENGAALAGATLTDTVGVGAEFVSIQIDDGAPIGVGENPDDSSDVQVTEETDGRRTLTYTFPEDYTLPDGNTHATVVVITRLTETFFQETEQTLISGSTDRFEWRLNNDAAIQGQEIDGEIPWESSDSASYGFDAQILTKKASDPVKGNASDKITWTLKIQVPYSLTNAVIYDLLTSKVTIEELDKQVQLGDPPYHALLNLTGEDGELFVAHAWRIIKGADITATEIIEMVQTAIGAHAFPQVGDTSNSPSALVNEINSMKAGETRDLVVIVPAENTAGNTDSSGNTLPSQDDPYEISFTTPIKFGELQGDDYKTSNVAYITYKLGGKYGEFIPPTVNVDYRQLAVHKVGEKNEATRTTTWTINANNNRQQLGDATIEDNLTSVLLSGDDESKLVTDKDGNLILKYWIGDSDNNKQDVKQLKTKPEGNFTDRLVGYVLEDNKLYIYVADMGKEIYHFEFQTVGVGSKFFGYTGNKDNITYDKLKVEQINAVTLKSENQIVETNAKVTYLNRFFDKAAGGPEGETGYNPADNTFWWGLYLNCYKENDGTITTVGRKITSASVTEQLPANTSLKSWALYEVETGGSLTPVEEDMAPKDNQDGTYTFDLGSRLADGSAYVLYVQVEVDTKHMDTTTGTGSYENKAWLEGEEDKHPIHAYDADTQQITQHTVSKDGKQLVDSDTNTYVYEATWTIDVNRNGKANGYTAPTLVDKLPEGATFTGVQIYQYDDSGKTPNTESELSNALKDNWKCEDGVFTFTLPAISDGDGTQADPPRYHAYQVVISADLSPSAASSQMENNAQLKAGDETIGEGGKVINVFAFGASATAAWGSPPPAGNIDLTIIKQGVDDLHLSGAVFTVTYRQQSDAEGTRTSYGADLVTDADGQLAIQNLPSDTVAVYLIETEAPFGYQKADGEITLTKTNDGSWSVSGNGGTASGNTITLTNTPAKYALSLEKQGEKGEKLSGVTFVLSTDRTKPADTAGLPKGTTETNGRVTITGLAANTTYYVYETAAHTGYLLPEGYVMVVQVADDGTVTCYETDGKTEWPSTVNGVAPVITNRLGDTVTVTGTKILKGRALKAGEFTFVLKDKDGTVLDTATNAADGSFSFTLRYDAGDEGKHTYTITEEAGTLTRVTYDKAVYDLTVTVAVDEETGNVTAASTLTKQGETDPVTSADFTNTYNPPGGGGHTTPKPTPSEDPSPDPSVPVPSGGIDIPDDDVPLDDLPDLPENPDNPPPVDPDDPPDEFDIPDGGIPLDDLPDLPEEEPDIPDGDVPLGDLPQTGLIAAVPVDPTATLGLIALAAALITGGMGLTYARRKNEEEDG